MKLYVPSVVEGQEWILPRRAADYEIFTGLRGMSQSQWYPPQMDLLRQRDDGTSRLHSDFPWCGQHVLMVRQQAVTLLRSSLERYGEFLRLRSDEAVSLFNVTTVVDALDEERSRIVRFDDGGILEIEKHVFRPDAIGNAGIFKLPERDDGVRVSSIYLQEMIVRRIGELGLKGIAFEMVWTDEDVSADEARIEYSGAARRGSASIAGSFWKSLAGRLQGRPLKS